MKSLETRPERLERLEQRQGPAALWDPEMSRRLGLLSLGELRALEMVYKQGEPGITPMSEAEIAEAMSAWEATAHG
jgi:hypothetical protein